MNESSKSETFFFLFSFLTFFTFLFSFPLFYKQINLLEKATAAINSRATRPSCMQQRTNQNKGSIKGEVNILSNNVEIKIRDNE